MRQAGRYLPEYMEYTKDTDFFHNCQTPERAKVITVQPERLDIDAAILFSDILIVPQALGMVVTMNKGPQFEAPLGEVGNIAPLIDPLVQKYGIEKVEAAMKLTYDRDAQVGRELVESLAYTKDALKLIRGHLDGKIPLIGFTGAPWTLMCYMLEGSSKPSYSGARRWFHECPEVARKLLALITNVCIELLLMQIENGAQIIQLFESHGGELTPQTFEGFALPAIELIASTIKRLHPNVPVILFGRNVGHSLEKCFSSTSFDAFSIDCNTPIAHAAQLAKKYNKTIQGNLDPCVLYSPKENIQAEVHKMMSEVGAVLGHTAGGAPNSYVANLGWGMLPTHKPDQLQAFIDAVHSYKGGQ
eukprot:TRINITY_DN31054_c0_g1_i1.p1 TRINITY_DN31054_c0_g1~~TRINITY_DN31054_c0_g1_i1.p1  ORF type:complete len:404 (+),score=110.66 TRINITY_DN31054_c0_g1_i1:137-1213(+)